MTATATTIKSQIKLESIRKKEGRRSRGEASKIQRKRTEIVKDSSKYYHLFLIYLDFHTTTITTSTTTSSIVRVVLLILLLYYYYYSLAPTSAEYPAMAFYSHKSKGSKGIGENTTHAFLELVLL